MDFEFIKKLTGYSGCNLELLSSGGGGFFVRKSSAGPTYKKRLRSQCLKQAAFFKERQKTPVLSPEVLRYGIEGENFYFDMEFVRGKTLAEFMPVASISEITYFVKILFSHIYNCDAVENTKANTIFRKKISELAENIKMSEPIRKSLALLKSFDWRYASESPCHGDLTLENIIVAPDKKLYLIDFLDSFYNSYLMDLAKLFRDLELGWSFRKQPVSTNRSLRLLIAKEAIMRELAELENAPQIIT